MCTTCDRYSSLISSNIFKEKLKLSVLCSSGIQRASKRRNKALEYYAYCKKKSRESWLEREENVMVRVE